MKYRISFTAFRIWSDQQTQKVITFLKHPDTRWKRTEEYLLLRTLTCYLESFNNLYVNSNILILRNLPLKYLNLLKSNKRFSMHSWAAKYGASQSPDPQGDTFMSWLCLLSCQLSLQECTVHIPVTLAGKACAPARCVSVHVWAGLLLRKDTSAPDSFPAITRTIILKILKKWHNLSGTPTPPLI